MTRCKRCGATTEDHRRVEPIAREAPYPPCAVLALAKGLDPELSPSGLEQARAVLHAAALLNQSLTEEP